MKKSIVIITSIVMVCCVLVSCSKGKTTNEDTSSPAVTSVQNEQSTDNATTTKNEDKASTVATSVKEAEAKSIIETMYSDYDIKLDKTLDNVQYYNISKDNTLKYMVKVDLVTGDCYETNQQTNELTTFNLLS